MQEFCAVSLVAALLSQAPQDIERAKKNGYWKNQNQTGRSTLVPDALAGKFLDFLEKKQIGRAIEIGPGRNGTVAIEALKRSRVEYFFYDLRYDRLQVKTIQWQLKASVVTSDVPSDQIKRIRGFVYGDFPFDFDPTELGSFDAIYMGFVLHLIPRHEVENGLKKLRLSTREGGRIFVSVPSIFNLRLKAFYENIMRTRNDDDDMGLMNSRDIATYLGSREDYPSQLYVYSESELVKIFKKSGWTVQESGYYSEPSARQDNRSGNSKERLYIVASR